MHDLTDRRRPSRARGRRGSNVVGRTLLPLGLFGLAGLLVPYVTDSAQKTHDRTAPNALGALNGAIARFERETQHSPDNLEALISAAGATAKTGPCHGAAAGRVYCRMMYPDFLRPVTLAKIQVASLAAAGIDTVLYNDADTDNATFESESGGPVGLTATPGPGNILAAVGAVAADAVSPGVPEASLTVEEHLAATFGGAPGDYDATCYHYIAFGVGDRNEMVGATMSSAPIHFPAQNNMGPVERYNRFLAVYRVDRDNTTDGCSLRTERAAFVGAAMAMDAASNHLHGAPANGLAAAPRTAP